jgi:hypothetical protein
MKQKLTTGYMAHADSVHKILENFLKNSKFYISTYDIDLFYNNKMTVYGVLLAL